MEDLHDQSKEDSLQARIRERWAAKQRSASTLFSSIALSERDSVSIPANNSGNISQGNGSYPTPSNSNATQDCMLPMSASHSCDVRQKDPFIPADTDACHCSPEIPSDTENNAGLSPLQDDILSVPDQGPHLQCRPKVRLVKGQTFMEASAEFEDDFECEVFQDSAESGRGKWKNCKKHPGHHEFIPVNDFTLKHLPESYRNEIFVKGIKSMAKVTALLKVNYNSTNRPRGYMFSNVGGKFLTHTGSGFVYSRLLSDNIRSMEVPDSLTDSGREDRGLQDHLAATYDEKADEERVKYLLEMLFKSLDEKEDGLGTISALAQPVGKVVTGTKDLYHFLSDYLQDSASDNEEDVDLLHEIDDSDDTPSVFGQTPKQDVMDIITEKGKRHGYFRTLVWFLYHSFKCHNPANECEKEYRRLRSMKNREKVVEKVSSLFETIFGPEPNDETCVVKHNSHDDDGISYPATDTDTDEDVQEANKKRKLEENECNAQGCYDEGVGEERQHYFSDQLNKNVLENVEDDDEAAEKRKQGDNENVQDSADKEDEQGGGQPNFSDQVDENVLENIEDEDEESLRDTFSVMTPCCCPPCTNSQTPEPKGYCVNVLTARHVVFDKEEAANTEVVLFYEDNSGSGEEKLYGVNVRLYSDAGDLAILMCATHDVKLIKRLRLLVVDMMENIETMKSESDTPLAVICSHPHGNFKHVTVGEWMQRDIYRRRDGRPPLWTSYLYNTPTCAGSSGAPVVILGHKEGTLLLDSMPHPHHGRFNQELNKSSRLISFDKELEDIGPKSRKRLSKEHKQLKRKIRGEMTVTSEKEAKMVTTMRTPLDKVVDKVTDTQKMLASMCKGLDNLDGDELLNKFRDLAMDVITPQVNIWETVDTLREPLGRVSKKILLKMLENSNS